MYVCIVSTVHIHLYAPWESYYIYVSAHVSLSIQYEEYMFVSLQYLHILFFSLMQVLSCMCLQLQCDIYHTLSVCKSFHLSVLCYTEEQIWDLNKLFVKLGTKLLNQKCFHCSCTLHNVKGFLS